MTNSEPHGRGPVEAVLSHHWDGHRLLYIEAVLLEATRQGRQLLVILNETARDAPDWDRIEQNLGHHELLTTDLANMSLEQAVPSSITRLIVLEADLIVSELPSLLRKMPNLHLVALLMREPGVTGLGSARRVVAVSGAKMALITFLTLRFGSRCSFQILRSPLFLPTPLTRLLLTTGRCSSIMDPVLNSGVSTVDFGPDQPEADPPVALVVGRLHKGKSIAGLLAAWGDPALQDYQLVIRGTVDHRNFGDFDDLVAAARSKGADIVVENRHLTDDELVGALTEATAVFCLYRSGLPSGIAALAIDAGCPVICFAHTRLGQAVAAHGVGSAIEEVASVKIAHAIVTCQSLSRKVIREKAASLHQKATTAHFSVQLLGRPPGSRRRVT